MDPSKDHSVTSTGTLSGTRWPKPTTTGDSDSGIHSRESQSETLFSPAASVGATPPQPRSVRTRRRSTSSANEIPKPGKRARGPQKHFCECGRDFPYVSKLRDHQKAHEVVKNIKCDYCTKVFKREREVTAHVKSVHKNIVSDPSMSISTQSSPLTYRHRPTSSVPEIATPSSQQSEGRTQGITPTSIIDDPPTQPSINEDPPGKIEINHPKSEHLTPKLEHITDSTEVPKVVVLETADDTEAKKDDHDNLSGPSNITNRSPQSPQSPLSPLSPNPKPQTPVPTPSFSTVQNLPTIETRMRYPTIELPENPNTPPSSGEESTKSETRSQISTSNDSPVLFGCGDSMNRKEDY
ncbi:hypothetical protein EDC01DRAFT_651799 [Geopyxis carbonaria]|nr:hypothetical protein EDC01DRAFT_651799 [Geopyxis carbonaria]